jgi:hypothetical protein
VIVFPVFVWTDSVVMAHAKESAQLAMFLALRVIAPTSRPAPTPTESAGLSPVQATSGAGMGTIVMRSPMLREAAMAMADACRKKKNV